MTTEEIRKKLQEGLDDIEAINVPELLLKLFLKSGRYISFFPHLFPSSHYYILNFILKDMGSVKVIMSLSYVLKILRCTFLN